MCYTAAALAYWVRVPPIPPGSTVTPKNVFEGPMHKGWGLHIKHRHQLRQYIETEVSLITHSGLPPPTGAQFFLKASKAPPRPAEALHGHMLFLLSHFPPTPPPSLLWAQQPSSFWNCSRCQSHQIWPTSHGSTGSDTSNYFFLEVHSWGLPLTFLTIPPKSPLQTALHGLALSSLRHLPWWSYYLTAAMTIHMGEIHRMQLTVLFLFFLNFKFRLKLTSPFWCPVDPRTQTKLTVLHHKPPRSHLTW